MYAKQSENPEEGQKNVKNSTPIPKTKRSFFTQLAVMPDGASCVGQCSKLREKGKKYVVAVSRKVSYGGRIGHFLQILLLRNNKKAETQRPFLEFNGNLESKTSYGVLRRQTCLSNLCALWMLSIEWKESLRLCVSAFFVIKVFR